MCWNAPVSLITFITSALMCLFLWYRNNSNNNDRALSIFIFWFSLMQLLEFFMWTAMQDHSFVSKLSLLALHLQPFALVAGLYYYSLKAKSSVYKYSKLEKTILLGIAAFSLLKTISAANYAFITNTDTNWSSVKGPHCHLVWWFSRNAKKLPQLAQVNTLWGILLFAALAMIKPLKQMFVYLLLGLMGWAFTYIYYPKEIGSIWCWIANFMGMIAIAMPYAMPYAMRHLV